MSSSKKPVPSVQPTHFFKGSDLGIDYDMPVVMLGRLIADAKSTREGCFRLGSECDVVAARTNRIWIHSRADVLGFTGYYPTGAVEGKPLPVKQKVGQWDLIPLLIREFEPEDFKALAELGIIPAKNVPILIRQAKKLVLIERLVETADDCYDALEELGLLRKPADLRAIIEAQVENGTIKVKD